MEGSQTTPGYALLGRYVVSEKIAAGGMATIHLGRLFAPGGPARTVAVKRLRPELATDAEFVTMFLDESRMARRIQHPNVVATLDVVSEGSEHFIVMEYIHGESLHYFLRALQRHELRMPLSIVGGVARGMLLGLHAAHEVTGEDGAPLGLIHRDVSPHNVLLGVDGRPRLLDFGVAKARGRVHQTRQGLIKGKIQYMSPEQIRGKPLDRRSDLFSAGIVLWEALVSKPLFGGEDDAEILARVLRQPIPPPSQYVPVSPEVDRVVLRALSREPEERYADAMEMAHAVERFFPSTDADEVGRWVADAAQSRLLKRQRQVDEIEAAASRVGAPPRTDRTVVLPSGELFVGTGGMTIGDAYTDPEQRLSEPGSSSSREREVRSGPRPHDESLDLLPPAACSSPPRSGATIPSSPGLPLGDTPHPARPSAPPAATVRIAPAELPPSARQPRVQPVRAVLSPRYVVRDAGPSLSQRLSNPVKLFMAAIALIVFESLLTKEVGFPLRVGWLTPSLVAGVLAAVSVFLGVWAFVGPELTGRSTR